MADTTLYQRATIAKFRGQCGLCQEAIEPHSDAIVAIEDEWAHVQCAEDEGYEIVEPESPRAPDPSEAWWHD